VTQLRAPPAVPVDAALPGLALLRDSERRIDVLSALLADWLGASKLLDVNVSLLSYLPAKRCVASLDLLVSPCIGCEPPRHRSVVAKLYAAEQDPVAIEATMRALHERGVSVPISLGVDPRWRMLLTERARGRLLRDVLHSESSKKYEAMERAADWLIKLHTCGMRTGRVYTFERHLSTLGTWQPRLAAALPEAGRLFAEVLGDVERRGRQLAGWQPAPTHRDFSPDHLVLDGERASGLDLDEFCQYDPLFDVAHFIAHLRLLGLLYFTTPDYFEQLAAHFQRSYAARARDYSVERAELYLAIANLKLAFICACIKQPVGWRQIALTLLHSARRDCPGG
jgi:aminoglycoside phosphotransferase (APT) family kinase protein